jgi:hypothetical protein
MQIRLGYSIELDISKPMAVIAVLNVHPSRVKDLLEPDVVQILPEVPSEDFTTLSAIDAFVLWPLKALYGFLIQR